MLKLLIALIVLTCLSGYVSAQWLSGQKFLNGAFRFSADRSLILFAGLIVLYTAIGGFRGSVYVDCLQAINGRLRYAIASNLLAMLFQRTEDRRMFFAVLHIPPVTSRRDAVRSAIVAEGKAK